jgi:stage IV sporulation protein B
MHKIIKRAAALVLSAALVGAAGFAVLRAALPDTFSVTPGSAVSIASMPWLKAGETPRAEVPVTGTVHTSSGNVTLSLFGIVPVKTVRMVETEQRSVNVCGTPFGIKMFSNGALVVAFSDFYTLLGMENPAKEAGLRLGDLIVSANGRTVRTNDELSQAIRDAAGAPVQIVYWRDKTEKECTLTPVSDSTTGAWKAGVWVRDSSAGIGTLTFTDPQHNTFAGLGHAISDTDTGSSISLLSGEIVPVSVTGYSAGAAGAPGELHGDFYGDETMGTVLANDATGVYGALTHAVEGESYPVANIQDVAPGAAQIMTTISGSTPELYDVRIERVSLNAADPNKNLLVRVTDERLLSATGGIIQGMSGSPILQNGALVGAVTHVLVNDPSRGYGIFAQTMLEGADACCKQDEK